MPIKEEPELKPLNESFEDFSIPRNSRALRWRDFIVPVIAVIVAAPFIYGALRMLLHYLK